ncbi:MAG TPA: SDR family oxidoreductase [Polyangia bacterium]|jgi:NAD(P)-dependent dehydrogenase (short-subunit alcohol dehydrogenase family)|nr:SDR family oxidoreductase [Polyangia bacterium]
MGRTNERFLEGQSALVTGGSQGLGRALGRALAAAGARVVLVARHPEPLAQAVAEIRVAGGEAHAIVADVADKDAAAAIAGQAAALVGPVDLLVNNASTLGPVPLRLLLDTDCEDLERALAVNLVGAFRLTKALAGPMVLRGAGTIVNITSDAATEAYERWGAYGVSKAALEQLGRVWAAELAGTGVRLFTVDPGEMDTQMHADAIPDANRAELSDPARVAERIVALCAATGAGDAPAGARVAIRVGPSQASAGEAPR